MINDIAGKTMFAVFSLLPNASGFYVYLTFFSGEHRVQPGQIAGVEGIFSGAVLFVLSALPSVVIAIIQTMYSIWALRTGKLTAFHIIFTFLAAIPAIYFFALPFYFI